MFWGCNCSWFCCCCTFCFLSNCTYSGCVRCMSSSFDSFLCIKYQFMFPFFPPFLFLSLIQIIYSIDTILRMYKSCILFSSIFLSNSSGILCSGILYSVSFCNLPLKQTCPLSPYILLLFPSCQFFWLSLYFHKGSKQYIEMFLFLMFCIAGFAFLFLFLFSIFVPYSCWL